MSIYVRFHDGKCIKYWDGHSVTYGKEVWTIKDFDGGWIASIVPTEGLIISPESDTETRRTKEHSEDWQRYTPTERGLKDKIESLEKVIEENNLKDLRAEKRKANTAKKNGSREPA